MKSLVKVALIGALSIGANAGDLLSKATGGSISDNAFGATTLNDTQMKGVIGGYIIQDFIFDKEGFAIAIAMPHDAFELGAYRNPDTKKLDYLYSDATSGLCKLGETKCYQNTSTFTHAETSTNRLMQYINALGPYILAEGFVLAFTVKRNIDTTDDGRRFTYFTYGTAAVNLKDYSIHPIVSSFNLENEIIKELRNRHQERFETGLGGLSIGSR